MKVCEVCKKDESEWKKNGVCKDTYIVIQKQPHRAEQNERAVRKI